MRAGALSQQVLPQLVSRDGDLQLYFALFRASLRHGLPPSLSAARPRTHRRSARGQRGAGRGGHRRRRREPQRGLPRGRRQVVVVGTEEEKERARISCVREPPRALPDVPPHRDAGLRPQGDDVRAGRRRRWRPHLCRRRRHHLRQPALGAHRLPHHRAGQLPRLRAPAPEEVVEGAPLHHHSAHPPRARVGRQSLARGPALLRHHRRHRAVQQGECCAKGHLFCFTVLPLHVELYRRSAAASLRRLSVVVVALRLRPLARALHFPAPGAGERPHQLLPYDRRSRRLLVLPRPRCQRNKTHTKHPNSSSCR